MSLCVGRVKSFLAVATPSEGGVSYGTFCQLATWTFEHTAKEVFVDLFAVRFWNKPGIMSKRQQTAH